jgi:uncharacterized protein Veg
MMIVAVIAFAMNKNGAKYLMKIVLTLYQTRNQSNHQFASLKELYQSVFVLDGSKIKWINAD